jgi:hypothetical protein
MITCTCLITCALIGSSSYVAQYASTMPKIHSKRHILSQDPYTLSTFSVSAVSSFPISDSRCMVYGSRKTDSAVAGKDILSPYASAARVVVCQVSSINILISDLNDRYKGREASNIRIWGEFSTSPCMFAKARVQQSTECLANSFQTDSLVPPLNKAICVNLV